MTRAGRIALWAAAGAASVGAFAWLGATTLPEGRENSFCVYRRATGMPCPGCGLTRSADHLASGRFHQAFTAHPLGPVLAFEAVLLWLGIGLWLLGTVPAPGRSVVEIALIAHLVAVVALWLGRAATGTLPW